MKVKKGYPIVGMARQKKLRKRLELQVKKLKKIAKFSELPNRCRLCKKLKKDRIVVISKKEKSVYCSQIFYDKMNLTEGDLSANMVIDFSKWNKFYTLDDLPVKGYRLA